MLFFFFFVWETFQRILGNKGNNRQEAKSGKRKKVRTPQRLNLGLFVLWPFPGTLSTVASTAPGESSFFSRTHEKLFCFLLNLPLPSFQYSSLFVVLLNAATVEKAKIQDYLYCSQSPDFTASSKAVWSVCCLEWYLAVAVFAGKNRSPVPCRKIAQPPLCTSC